MNLSLIQILTSAAIVVGSLTVVIGGIAGFLYSKPVKWFGRQIMDDFAEKLGKVINDGIEAHHRAEVIPHLDCLKVQLTEVDTRAVEGRKRLHARLDGIEQHLHIEGE